MAKKIGAIVSLSIIGILILATIIMANVNVDYSIRCATPKTIYISYGANAERDAQDCTDEIVDFISNASKEKSLTALFNGNLGKKANIVAVSNVGKNLPENSGFYVRYRYEDKQKLKYGKEDYKDSNGEVVLYQDLVFEVKDIDGTGKINVYVIPDSTNSRVYTHYYELEADFGGLYDYLVENNFNN